MTDTDLDRLFEDSKLDRHMLVGSEVRVLIGEIRRARAERDQLRETLKAAESRPPPVCTGTGTIMVDFSPVSSGMPSEGLCGICRQHVPLMSDCQTIAPHPYRAVLAKAEGREP